MRSNAALSICEPLEMSWLRGQDLHLRLEVMSLSYCPTLLPRHTSENWSGWQELNLRGHAPKACGWPLPYTRTLVARHGIEPCPLALQTSTLPSSSRAKLWWTVRELNSHFTVAGRG